MIKKTLSALALLLVAGVAFHWFSQSEEAKIKQEFRKIEKWGSKTSTDTKLGLAAKVKKIRERFGDPCYIYFEETGQTRTYARQNISAGIFNHLSRYAETTLSFRDLRVELTSDNTATVFTLLHMKGRLPNGEIVRDRYELLFRLTGTGSDRLIQTITVIGQGNDTG